MICWNSGLIYFYSSLQEFFALFLYYSQYTIGHLVKLWLSLCFTIFLDFYIYLIFGLSSQEIFEQLKLLSSTLVPSICQADNTSILICSTFCGDTNFKNLQNFYNFFLLFLFCWVLEILCNLNKVANRVKILFLCPQKYWPSYPTKIQTISAVVKYFVRYIYILNSIYIVL